MLIKTNLANSVDDKRPGIPFGCLVSSFKANFMLADSKLGLGIAGNGMEPWQCEKPIRHLTFSMEQRAQVINFRFKYFHSIPFHAHSDTHPVWLHVYKAIYRKLCAGWVIKVQTPFFNRQKRRQRKSCRCPWVAANGIKSYQKMKKYREFFSPTL